MMRKFSERFTLNELQEETPQKIVKSTLEEISVNGVMSITTKRISQRADMSTGIIHHYFDTKDNLVYAAYVHLVLDLYQRNRAICVNEHDPVQRLRAMIRSHFSSEHLSVAASNVWPQFWAHSLHDERVARLLYIYSRRSHSNLVATFQEIFHHQGRARRAAHQLFAMLHGIWLDHRVTGVLKDAEYAMGLADEQLDYLLGG